ncbi:hypothetical protein FQN53_004783 [Emmonsiellopsis sp. PD_33]|nr:hypothetical protein FQN53_004783 [Emmonsiellopsis sp. PD_33]
MVSLDTVRASNLNLKKLGPGLVAVFVGGTSGIGETTAREFVRHADRPRVYLVGRNEARASQIIEELKKLNPDGKIDFLKADLELLRNVDEVCEDIKKKEEKINLLFLSPESSESNIELPNQETTEGLDTKFNLHYYSRMRFIVNLLPLLSAGANSNPAFSRVVSILSGGHEGKLNLEDLALKNTFSLQNCATHAITMNSLTLDRLATAHPNISFVHAYPGFVKTSLGRSLGTIGSAAFKGLMYLVTPLAVPFGESGERNLYAATSSQYPPKSAGDSEDAEVGSDGVRGSGAYLLHWTGKANQNQELFDGFKAQGWGEKVWDHTLDVFEKVCGKEGPGKY